MADSFAEMLATYNMFLMFKSVVKAKGELVVAYDEANANVKVKSGDSWVIIGDASSLAGLLK